MALNADGVTQIPFPGGIGLEDESFRFVVTAVDGKLTIRLEDRKTKRQWRTPDLRVEDFAGSTSTIPQATTEDYAKHFVECLRATLTDTDDAGRTYDRSIGGVDKDGSRVMVLKLKFTLASFGAWLGYEFTLLPVALESVDLLAAQVRDLKDEVNELKQQAQRAMGGHASAAVFRSQRAQDPNSVIQWKLVRAVDPSRFGIDEDGDVVFCESGSYLVCVTVKHESKFNGPVLVIESNRGFVESCGEGPGGGKLQLARECIPMYVEKSDYLRVVYQGDVCVTENDCFLSLIEL